MKKLVNLSFLAVMAISMAFVACKKDPKDDPKDGPGYVIEAKNVEDSIDDIANVAAIKGLDVFEANPDCIAKGKFQSSGFKLTLPNVLADKYLSGSYPDSPETKYESIEIIALNTNGKNIGLFSYGSDVVGGSTVLINYVYHNADYLCQRSFSYEYQGITWQCEINCNYKKGWNKEYFTINYNTNETKTTLQQPSGVSYSWMFLPTSLKAPVSMQTPQEIYAKELKMRMQR